MTTHEQLQLLEKKVAESSEAAVSRAIGYFPSAVNQVRKGTYKGDPANILKRVEEVFGGTTVQCPVAGEILLSKCAENRRRPFAATNPDRVRLHRACRACEKGGKV